MSSGFDVIALFLSQAIGSVLIAILLYSLHGQHQQSVFRDWCWSWLTFAGCQFLAVLLLWLSPIVSSTSLLYLVTMIAMLTLGYWHIGGLLRGVLYLKRRPKEEESFGWLLVFLTIPALLTVSLSWNASLFLQAMVRIGILRASIGIVFIVSAEIIRRQSQDLKGFSRWCLILVFLTYGLNQFNHVAALWLGKLTVEGYVHWLKEWAWVDALWLAVMGFAVAFWILEFQARQSRKTQTIVLDQAEQERVLQEQLVHERRLKVQSLSTLVGSVAHNFNNLLTIILGNANLVGFELPKRSPLRDYITAIESASENAAALCQQMLAYAGRCTPSLESFEMVSLVQRESKKLRDCLPDHLSLEFELSEDPLHLEGDSQLIIWVLMELVKNAGEALQDRQGKVICRISKTRIEESSTQHAVWYGPESATELDNISGEFIVLEVTDNGNGMSNEVIARMFEPFFTTRFLGRGLGLAAAYGITQAHDGHIRVSSVLGKGTTVQILLPPRRSQRIETGSAYLRASS